MLCTELTLSWDQSGCRSDESFDATTTVHPLPVTDTVDFISVANESVSSNKKGHRYFNRQ